MKHPLSSHLLMVATSSASNMTSIHHLPSGELENLPPCFCLWTRNTIPHVSYSTCDACMSFEASHSFSMLLRWLSTCQGMLKADPHLASAALGETMDKSHCWIICPYYFICFLLKTRYQAYILQSTWHSLGAMHLKYCHVSLSDIQGWDPVEMSCSIIKS